MIDSNKNVLKRPEVQNFLTKYKLGYDFEAADSIITEEERLTHNEACWIRNGIPMGDGSVVKMNATPFLTWLASLTGTDVGNFKVRHSLNVLPPKSDDKDSTLQESLKQIRHRINHGESQARLL